MFFSKRPPAFDDRHELPPEVGVGEYLPVDRSQVAVIIERRAHPRHAFPYHQRIAEQAVDGRLRRVRSLRCHDLSRGGFSYWSDRRPDAATLLVDLGIGDEMMRLRARICHATPISAAPSSLWLVGCAVESQA